MANLVVHFELHATEPELLIDFYSGLFGWTFTSYADGMDYWVIDTGEGSIQLGAGGHGINGGLTRRRGPRPEPGAPINGANLVIGLSDVDGTYTRGLALGGTSALPPDDLPGVGRLAYLHDPDGNVFGFISPILSDGTNAMGG